MIHGHGDDLYNQQFEVKYNFSSNVDRHKDYSELRAFIQSKIDCIHSYPEPDAHSLKELLAETANINIENLIITNGATEAIYMIAQCFQRVESTIVTPTFSEYEDACNLNKHKLNFVYSIDSIPASTNLVWLCNPNNPTGNLTPKSDLIKLFSNYPSTLFIIDQSYEYFALEEVHSPLEVTDLENVLLIQSMTKHYSIPGLRLGYITANKNLINRLSHYKLPWSVNQLAIEAGKYLIKHTTKYHLQSYLREAKRLAREISKCDIEVFPSSTHFMLCKLKRGTSHQLKKYLLQTHGILIRDASNFRGLDNSYFRIASQTVEENNILIKALKEWNTLTLL